MEKVSVMITIGGDMALGITERQNLVLCNANATTIIKDLGRATKRRIVDLQDYLERLKIHAT